MGQLIISNNSGSSILSEDTTAISQYVLKGETYIGLDTNDEVGVGTLELTGEATAPYVVENLGFYNTNPLAKERGTLKNRNIIDSAIGGINASYPNIAIHKGSNLQIGTTTNSNEKIIAIKPPVGYYDGDNSYVGDLASNFGNASAAQVLSGSTFTSSNGVKASGTMSNRGAVTKSLNCGGSYTIPAGYHNGSGKVTANSLASQTSATATAAYIYSGKTAWVNGVKITGNMTCNSILSFSAAATYKNVTLTWRNPVAASGKPYYGVFIAYSTSGYPGADASASRAYTGYGNNTASGGYSSVTISMPSYYTTYYFSATAYVSFYNNGTWFTDIWGNTLNATCKTGGSPCSCDDDCCDYNCYDCSDECGSVCADGCGPGD